MNSGFRYEMALMTSFILYWIALSNGRRTSCRLEEGWYCRDVEGGEIPGGMDGWMDVVPV